jgi:hypothetical protein
LIFPLQEPGANCEPKIALIISVDELQIYINRELAHVVTVEVVLIILDFVENLNKHRFDKIRNESMERKQYSLNSHILLQRKIEFAVAVMGISLFDEVQQGLHVFQIRTRACCIFLRAYYVNSNHSRKRPQVAPW